MNEKMQKHTSDLLCYNPVFFIIDEKEMIRNSTSFPSHHTGKEHKQSRRHKEITAQAENQEISSFPVDVHQDILNIMNI